MFAYLLGLRLRDRGRTSTESIDQRSKREREKDRETDNTSKNLPQPCLAFPAEKTAEEAKISYNPLIYSPSC